MLENIILSDIEKTILNVNYKNFKCPVCGELCKSNVAVTYHIIKYHPEIYKKVKEFKIIKEENSKVKEINCPICFKKFTSLYRHITKTHNMAIEDFKDKYPLYPLQIDNRKKDNQFICNKCNFKTNLKNIFVLHLKECNYDEYLNIKSKDYSEGYECRICNRISRDLKQHSRDSHNLEWNEYCEKYNWDKEKVKYITDEYRKNLSDSKIYYYNETKEGMIRKQRQSKKIKGYKNPACKPEVKSKISKKAIERIDKNNFFEKSFGIKVKFLNYTFRSFEEFKITFLLYKNNIPFLYENEIIEYIMDGVKRNYIVDFIINNNYYEIKTDLKNLDEKYKFISNKMNIENKNFKITTYKKLKKDLKLNENYDIYKECKNLLDKNEINFSFYTYHENSEILNKITKDYKNHKNIKFIRLGVKNDTMETN